MLRHAPDEDVADGVQMRPAVVVDDAFGVAGGAGGVVERDGLPLVGGIEGRGVGIALGEEGFVVEVAEVVAARTFRVVDVDDEEVAAEALQGLGHHRCELGVGDQRPGLAVLQDEGQCCGVEAGVQRIEDGPAVGDAVVGLQHGRRVGKHGGHRVAGADAASGQG
jgi:hypothetical protein